MPLPTASLARQSSMPELSLKTVCLDKSCRQQEIRDRSQKISLRMEAFKVRRRLALGRTHVSLVVSGTLLRRFRVGKDVQTTGVESQAENDGEQDPADGTQELLYVVSRLRIRALSMMKTDGLDCRHGAEIEPTSLA